MKKITAAKFLAATIVPAMLLTGCGSDKPAEGTASVTTTISETAATETTTAATEETVSEQTVNEETTAAEGFDFSIYEDAPVLGGEPREIDWSMLFEEDCIVIGGEKYPAYVKIGDLSSDIELEIIGVNEPNTACPEYMNDYYGLNYLGHTVGAVITSRKADVEPKEAYICTWMMGGECDVPREKTGMMGFSLAQSYDEVTGVYNMPDSEEDGVANYKGVTENNGEKFSCSLFYSDYIVMLDVTPYDANPDMYDKYSAE